MNYVIFLKLIELYFFIFKIFSKPMSALQMGCRKSCWLWYLHDALAGMSTCKSETLVSLQVLRLSGNGIQGVPLLVWHKGGKKKHLMHVLLLLIGSVCHILLCFPLLGWELTTCSCSAVHLWLLSFLLDAEAEMCSSDKFAECHLAGSAVSLSTDNGDSHFLFSECRTCSVYTPPPWLLLCSP